MIRGYRPLRADVMIRRYSLSGLTSSKEDTPLWVDVIKGGYTLCGLTSWALPVHPSTLCGPICKIFRCHHYFTSLHYLAGGRRRRDEFETTDPHLGDYCWCNCKNHSWKSLSKSSSCISKILRMTSISMLVRMKKRPVDLNSEEKENQS